MKTDTSHQRDTNTGFHPPMKNDAPATKAMFAIILVLLVVGAIIAMYTYNTFNSEPKYPAPTEQVTPPFTP